MKKTILMILIILLVLVGLIFIRNIFAKTILQNSVKLTTGLGLRIRRLNIGLLKPEILVQDMRLYSPRGFPDRLMAYLPEFYINYDLGSFFKGKPHLYSMRIYLKEFTVVKNAKGQTNVNEIKTVKSRKEEEQTGTKRKAPQIKIDNLILKIERVILKDYSQDPQRPQQKVFNVNINEQYKNIDNPQRLVNLIVFRALTNTTIGSIANVDLSALQQDVADILKQATGAIKGFFESIFGTK